MITKEKIVEVLKTVDDPEIGIDVYTLGLIYDIKIDNSKVNIRMTFTTPMCPYGPMLIDMIESEIKEKIKDVSEVKCEVTFEPPWEAPEELKIAYGLE